MIGGTIRSPFVVCPQGNTEGNALRRHYKRAFTLLAYKSDSYHQWVASQLISSFVSALS